MIDNNLNIMEIIFFFKYNTIRTIPKYNGKILEKGKIENNNMHNTHIHDRSLS
jgi:hypothetical protein